jgi:hypothetical protein
VDSLIDFELFTIEVGGVDKSAAKLSTYTAGPRVLYVGFRFVPATPSKLKSVGDFQINPIK